MKKKVTISIIGLMAFFTLFAQTERQLLPSEIKQLTIVNEPATLSKGFLRAGMSVTFGVVDKYFNDKGKKLYFPESLWATSWSTPLVVQYGITDRLAVSLLAPYTSEDRTNSSTIYAPGLDQDQDNGWNLKGSGIGDILVDIRYQLLQESLSAPSIIGEVGITFPTGRKNPTNIKDDFDFTLPTGYGEFVVDAGVRVRKTIYPFSYTVYGRYTHSFGGSKLFQPSDIEERDFQSGPRFDAGGNVNFLLNDWIALANELNFFYSGEGSRQDAAEGELLTQWAFSYEPRLLFQIKQFRVGEAVRIPLKGKSVAGDPLYVLLVQYVF